MISQMLLRSSCVFQRSLAHLPSRIHFITRPTSKHFSQALTRTVLAPAPYKPACRVVTLLAGCGLGAACFHRKWRFLAQCDQQHHTSRISGADLLDKSSTKKEPEFPWPEFFTLLWPDIWYLIGAIVSALGVAIINVEIPLILGDLVNVLSRYARDTAGNFLTDIQRPALTLVYYYCGQAVLTFFYISLLGSLGESMASRLRIRLFESILKQDIAFFDTHKTGDIINRLTTDVQDFKSSFKMCVSQGLRSFTQIVGCVGSLLLLSPKLTLLMALVVPSIIGVGSLMGRGLRSLSRRAQAQVSKATAVADEAVGNARTVRAFAMESMEVELYSAEVNEAERLNTRLGVGIGVFQGLSNLALNGVVLGTLYCGGLMMSRSEIKAGDMMSFLVSIQTIQRSLAQMSLLFGQAVRGLSAGARVFEYIQLQPSLPLTGGKRLPYHSMTGQVDFTDVGFHYPSRPEQTILENFTLNIPGGAMVALVGLSGGGKSTMAALLERFYDVNHGSIKIDGHDLRDLDPTWLRGTAIGYINQEPVLFATSVMENIRYGRPSATDQEVIEAAKLANAHDFVQEFPEGYGTILGERGLTVSGGQKQRIAIARALVKQPSILILDEATSALDAESERVVQQALDGVVRGRTVLVIAHRLSTIRDAHLIAVIDGGHIVEMGTHKELTKKRGRYWKLMQQQQNDSMPHPA